MQACGFSRKHIQRMAVHWEQIFQCSFYSVGMLQRTPPVSLAPKSAWAFDVGGLRVAHFYTGTAFGAMLPAYAQTLLYRHRSLHLRTWLVPSMG
jgi:hypothetical protein